jgi:hypothetical protein
MERILSKNESDVIVSLLPKLWEAVYPDWHTVKNKLTMVYSLPKDEVDAIGAKMDQLMAERGFRSPHSDDPHRGRYESIVFDDEDAYQWFLQNWK